MFLVCFGMAVNKADYEAAKVCNIFVAILGK
jgi:hypothetical protein